MHQSSHAILLLEDACVLQLRDDKPGIPCPGQWSLFGGRKDASESALECIQRETWEELGIRPPEFRFLWTSDDYAEFERDIVREHFFVARVDPVWGDHRLTEGQRVGVFRFAELESLSIPGVMRRTLDRYFQDRA